MTGAEWALALTAFKELQSLLEKHKDKKGLGEIVGKVNEIQLQMSQLRTQYLELQLENERLRKPEDLSDRVTMRGSFVYLDGDFSKRFCEHCWYAKQNTIPLQGPFVGGVTIVALGGSGGRKKSVPKKADTYRCPQCGTNFRDTDI